MLCEAGWRRALERGASAGGFGACPTRDGKERQQRRAAQQSDEEDRQESEPGLAASVAAVGTSRTITAIAIAAIAIQNHARFGWKAFIPGGESIARARDKGDKGTREGYNWRYFSESFPRRGNPLMRRDLMANTNDAALREHLVKF